MPVRLESNAISNFGRRVQIAHPYFHDQQISAAAPSRISNETTFRLPKNVSASMHAFCAVRKKFLQTCETFSPSEQSFRKRACLLKHPRKVPAAITTFSATEKFFVQRRLQAQTEFRKPKFKMVTLRARRVALIRPRFAAKTLAKISKKFLYGLTWLFERDQNQPHKPRENKDGI